MDDQESKNFPEIKQATSKVLRLNGDLQQAPH